MLSKSDIMVVENCMYCFGVPPTDTVCTPGEIPHDEAENQIPEMPTSVSKSAAPQKKVSVDTGGICDMKKDLVCSAAVQTVSPLASPTGLIFKSERVRPGYASVKQLLLSWATTAKISRK